MVRYLDLITSTIKELDYAFNIQELEKNEATMVGFCFVVFLELMDACNVGCLFKYRTKEP